MREGGRAEGSSLTNAGTLVVASGSRLTCTNATSMDGSNHRLGALKWKRRVGIKAGRGRVGRRDATQPLSHLLNDSEGLLEFADEVTEIPGRAGCIIPWGLQEVRHVHDVDT